MAGLFDTPKRRKPFAINTKRVEWLLAGGRDPNEYFESGKFFKTSYCRKCKTRLIWGDGSYNFDHLDNNAANNKQTNCYLVCRNCHGKATILKTVKIRDAFGIPIGIGKRKLKVGYKRPKTKKE